MSLAAKGSDQPSAAALWEAVFWADIDRLSALLRQPGVPTNAAIGSGSSALGTLSGGAIGAGDTAFHISCSKGYVSCAQLLIDAGCDTACTNAAGLTGWDLAETFWLAEHKPQHGNLLQMLHRLADGGAHELLSQEKTRTTRHPPPSRETQIAFMKLSQDDPQLPHAESADKTSLAKRKQNGVRPRSVLDQRLGHRAASISLLSEGSAERPRKASIAHRNSPQACISASRSNQSSHVVAQHPKLSETSRLALHKSWQALQLAREELDRKTIEVESLKKALQESQLHVDEVTQAACRFEKEFNTAAEQRKQLQTQLEESRRCKIVADEASEVAEASRDRMASELRTEIAVNEELKSRALKQEQLDDGAEQLLERMREMQEKQTLLDRREQCIEDSMKEASAKMRHADILQNLATKSERKATMYAEQAHELQQQSRERWQNTESEIERAAEEVAKRKLLADEAMQQARDHGAHAQNISCHAVLSMLQAGAHHVQQENVLAARVASLQSDLAKAAEQASAEAEQLKTQLVQAEVAAKTTQERAEMHEYAIEAMHVLQLVGVQQRFEQQRLEESEEQSKTMQTMATLHHDELRTTRANAEIATKAASSRAEVAEMESGQNIVALEQARFTISELQITLAETQAQLLELRRARSCSVDEEEVRRELEAPQVHSALPGHTSSGSDLSPLTDTDEELPPPDEDDLGICSASISEQTTPDLKGGLRSHGMASTYTETSAAGPDTIWMYTDRNTPLQERGDVVEISEHPVMEWRVLDPHLGLLQTADGLPHQMSEGQIDRHTGGQFQILQRRAEATQAAMEAGRLVAGHRVFRSRNANVVASEEQSVVAQWEVVRMDHSGGEHSKEGCDWVVLLEQVESAAPPCGGQRIRLELSELVVVPPDRAAPSTVELVRGQNGFGVTITDSATVGFFPTSSHGILSPAQRAGVVRGQQLIAVDGARVPDAESARRMLCSKTGIGTKVVLQFGQSKKSQAITSEAVLQRNR